MKQRILILVFSLLISIFYPAKVQAAENLNDKNIDEAIVIIEHTPEQIAKDKQKAKENLMQNSQILRMDEEVEKWEEVSTKTVVKKAVGYAANQKANGTVFASKGGFYWQDGGNNLNIDFSVNFGNGLFSFTLPISPGKSSTTGTWITSPYINTPCKLYIHKDVTVTQYKVYRKNKYQPDSAYAFVGYQYTSVDTRDYLSVVKV